MDDVTDAKRFLNELNNQDDAMVRWQRLRQRSNGDDRARTEQAKQEREKKEREMATHQQKIDTAEAWRAHDDRTYEIIRLWAEDRFAGYARLWAEREIVPYIDLWAKHMFDNVWQDVIGQILADERHSVRKQVAEATKTMQGRIEELEKRHTTTIEQTSQRITALESEMAATRDVIDAIKRELTEGVTKRIGDLEVTYWGHRETDQQDHAEQTKEINDRLTTFERHIGDIKRDLAEA
jgi:hypothetical protein